MSNYLPSKESELKVFAANFAALVTATPVTYGLVAGDATQISAAATDFATKYDLAFNPATRTAATIDAKNTAKNTLTAILRGYAMQIKSNRAVTDAAKINLGIGVYDFSPTPVPAPATFPLINIVAATPRQHEIRFADSATPDKKSKPTGALGLQFFCSVGEVPPADPLTSRFQAFVTKQPYMMDFEAADVGKTAFYYARWQTRTGQVGPWSQVASMTVAG
jgi:hypothetical protein